MEDNDNKILENIKNMFPQLLYQIWFDKKI